MQHNVYTPNVNPMFRMTNPNSNQIHSGNRNNLNDLDGMIKHELPSPPSRQIINNWATNGFTTKRTNAGGVYLQHPTLPMGISGPGDPTCHSDNNSYPASDLEGMSLLKQLEYNHNGYLNDVPMETSLYGYGYQTSPSVQRDYP